MKQGLLRGILTFGSWTFLSRVLGLVRDVIVGAVFGSGAATDAFFVAFKIPNFMRRLFAEGAFSQAFVPVISQYKTTRDTAEVRRLVADTSGALASVLLVLTLIGVLAAPQVVSLFAPGFADEAGRHGLATEMLRWTFPYILFISLAACAGGTLNAYGQFGPPAFAPVLLNVLLIIAALGFTGYFAEPIVALAAAVFVAGIAQFLVQLPYLRRLGLLAWPRWGWRSPGVRRILRLMGPAVFGSSVAQINLLVGTILASFLVTGSVSWLYFSDRLVEFPLGILGVALGTVILPRLSGEYASQEPQRFSSTLDWALRWGLIISVPATAALFLLAVPLLATLFQHGAFDAAAVRASSLSLMAYSLGLGGFILVKIVAPGYFSRQDTRTPVRYAVVCMVVNMVLSVIAVLLLRDTGIGHAALAGVTAFAAWLNGLMLLAGLRRAGVYRPAPGWGRLLGQVGAATVAMAALLYWPGAQAEAWLTAGIGDRLLWLTPLVIGGAAVYFAVLHFTGMPWSLLRGPRAS